MPNTVNSEILLENLRVALILIDQERVVQTVNLAAETLLGHSRRHLIGKKFDEIMPLPQASECVTRCLQNNAQFTMREVSVKLSSRTVLLDMTLSAVAGSKPMVLIEISSINRISRFMKEKNQFERRQSFRLMMRSLAHEIKNPLGGIRGAAQLLDRELSDPGSKELTNILIKEADRLTRLVDRVMGSRSQLRLVDLNIHEILEHVVGLVTVKQDKQLAVERFYDTTLPNISADKEQLIQALLNIVGNAVEAQKGMMKPTIGLVTQFERYVTINQELHRQVIGIKIWDDGPGVDDDIRDILFDPLITSRPTGTGLGLSITQEIIQRHKGLVQLEEYQGKTCFSISLPYLSPTNIQPDNQVSQ